MDRPLSSNSLFNRAKEILRPCSARKKNVTTNQLEGLITKSIKFLKKEIPDFNNIQDVRGLIKLVEELITALNEVHSSLHKVLLNFDVKLMPLLEIYINLLVYDGRSSGSEMEAMKKLTEFLNSLTLHPTLMLSQAHRTQDLLTRLLMKMASEETGTLETSENSKAERNPGSLEETTVKLISSSDQTDLESPKECQSREEGEKVDGPSVIPESPAKSPKTSCVGTATVCEIMPFSCGFLLPLTPPQADLRCNDTSLGSDNGKKVFSRTMPSSDQLLKLQVNLRKRFHRPNAVTPTEKKVRQAILRTIQSERRPKRLSWRVQEFISPPRGSDALVQPLFVETDQISLSDQLDLHYSPDQESNPRSSSSVNLNQKEDPEPITCSKTSNSIFPSTPEPSIENQNQGMEIQSEAGRTEETYSALKKSIDGNILGCEASLSDVELMDEIESSLNMEGDEDNSSSFRTDPVVFIDPLSMTCQMKILPDLTSAENSVVPTPETPVSVDVAASEPEEKREDTSLNRSSSSVEKKEIRRSSRLAGIPALPLKYRTEPLPDCRRVGTKKSAAKPQTASQQTENDPLALSPKRTHSTDPMELCHLSSSTDSKDKSPLSQMTWQEICLWLPNCWVDLLKNHVRIYHPNGTFHFKDTPGARYPSINCDCVQIKSRNQLSESSE